ncbi:MAG: helix-turn-helix domain-containing protein [Clostridia bacterium]|nr:helix-turn-helix domain-containing protein [Clostridia bacterium]
MFYDSELFFLQKIFKKIHLQFILIDPTAALDQQIDLGLRKLLGKDTELKSFNEYFDIGHNAIYKYLDNFLCHYFFLRLPEKNNEYIISIGPYLSNELSKEQIFENAERFGLQPGMVKELENYYSGIPLIPDTGFVFAVLNSFGETIWSGSDNFTILDINSDDNTFSSFDVKETGATPEDTIWNMQIMEERYNFENELMHAVALGQTHKGEMMLTSFSSRSFEKRLTDQLRNTKNYCIIMNTLLRKAAETGGVHPVYLDTISSDYAKRIEQLNSNSKVQDFMFDMFRNYCRLVRSHSIKQYSPPIQKTITCIDADLTADLSLSKLAEINNVNASYLSTLFKNETGQTLTDFVNMRRIKLAKKLLSSTNLQVQTISQYCGILDVHYFSKLFKKYEGVTPKAYRERLKN